MKLSMSRTEHLALDRSHELSSSGSRLAAGGLASLLLTCVSLIPTQGASTPSTWNSPADYDSQTWSYDATAEVWRDKVLYSGKWDKPPQNEPLWDDDDFIFTWMKYIHVLDHDLRYKHSIPSYGNGARSLAFTPDGKLRFASPDGSHTHDWSRAGQLVGSLWLDELDRFSGIGGWEVLCRRHPERFCRQIRRRA
jgi:hypothetical protein